MILSAGVVVPIYCSFLFQGTVSLCPVKLPWQPRISHRPLPLEILLDSNPKTEACDLGRIADT